MPCQKVGAWERDDLFDFLGLSCPRSSLLSWLARGRCAPNKQNFQSWPLLYVWGPCWWTYMQSKMLQSAPSVTLQFRSQVEYFLSGCSTHDASFECPSSLWTRKRWNCCLWAIQTINHTLIHIHTYISIYIYICMHAVKLLSGPSLAILSVIIWAKWVLLPGPGWCLAFFKSGLKRFVAIGQFSQKFVLENCAQELFLFFSNLF